MSTDPIGTAQVGQSQVGEAVILDVVLPPSYSVYKPRPLFTLTIGADTKRYSTEDLEVPDGGYPGAYGETEYGDH